MHRRSRARRARELAALVAAIALAVAACGPGPSPAPNYTSVHIGPTPWPAGTTGQFGLHIDPSLLAKLPSTVDAYPLVEDALSENQALDDADLAKTFDRYAAAAIGNVGSDNWLNIVIGHRKPEAQTPEVLAAWIDQYATGACSQANGVSATAQETINDWTVDTATCQGGPVVYTLSLGNGVVLSMFGFGPRDLGRALIKAIYSS
jgi:hypothetical protein